MRTWKTVKFKLTLTQERLACFFLHCSKFMHKKVALKTQLQLPRLPLMFLFPLQKHLFKANFYYLLHCTLIYLLIFIFTFTFYSIFLYYKKKGDTASSLLHLLDFFTSLLLLHLPYLSLLSLYTVFILHHHYFLPIAPCSLKYVFMLLWNLTSQ